MILWRLVQHRLCSLGAGKDARSVIKGDKSGNCKGVADLQGAGTRVTKLGLLNQQHSVGNIFCQLKSVKYIPSKGTGLNSR